MHTPLPPSAGSSAFPNIFSSKDWGGGGGEEKVGATRTSVWSLFAPTSP